jgi:DNA/RNA endonuclease G (NUC1)
MDAADNSCNPRDMHECFFFSNMTAQTKHLNEITWEKLEEHTRNIAARFGTVEVWCGSYGKKAKSGPMTIPSKCWKVIRYNNTIEAYIFPNTTTVSRKKYTAYKSTVSGIRMASHLASNEIAN